MDQLTYRYGLFLLCLFLLTALHFIKLLLFSDFEVFPYLLTMSAILILEDVNRVQLTLRQFIENFFLNVLDAFLLLIILGC